MQFQSEYVNIDLQAEFFYNNSIWNFKFLFIFKKVPENYIYFLLKKETHTYHNLKLIMGGQMGAIELFCYKPKHDMPKMWSADYGKY